VESSFGDRELITNISRVTHYYKLMRSRVALSGKKRTQKLVGAGLDSVGNGDIEFGQQNAEALG
jgi:hypothetical protein